MLRTCWSRRCWSQEGRVDDGETNGRGNGALVSIPAAEQSPAQHLEISWLPPKSGQQDAGPFPSVSEPAFID